MSCRGEEFSSRSEMADVTGEKIKIELETFDIGCDDDAVLDKSEYGGGRDG